MMRIRHLASLATLFFVPAALGQQFVYNAAALPNQNIWTNGVALADVDGDLDLDIVFANGSQYGANGQAQQHLFLNNGSGVFTAAHAQLNVANINAHMVIAKDFDGDGDLDLMYSLIGAYPAVTQKPHILINNGAGTFADETNTRLPNVLMASFCVAAGDVDNDGDLDVALTDGATFSGTPSQAHLYKNNGLGFFTDATATNLPADLYNAQDVAFGDWENDGDVDIFLSGKGSATLHSRLYLNNGSGVYAISNLLNNVGNGNTYETDPADLDGDGDLDVAVQSISSASEGWTRNNGASVVNTTFSGTNGNDDNEMASVDYDNDGDLDVMVCSLAFNAEKAYNNNGAANPTFTFAPNIFTSLTDSSLDFGFADLNGDRRYDCVTCEGESGSFLDKVYFNNGPQDTRAPAFVKDYLPGTLNTPGANVRIQIRDAVHDDGEISASAYLVYGTDDGAGGTSGVQKAENMGCGLMRSGFANNGATSNLSYVWVGRDDAHNSTSYGNGELGGANGITNLGNGLAGVWGVPTLAVGATLKDNTAGSVALFSAKPNTTTYLMVGLAAGNVPTFGGILVPFPLALQIPLPTDARGDVSFPFVWPAGLQGASVYMQCLTGDAAAPFGVSFSNAVQLVGQ